MAKLKKFMLVLLAAFVRLQGITLHLCNGMADNKDEECRAGRIAMAHGWWVSAVSMPVSLAHPYGFVIDIIIRGPDTCTICMYTSNLTKGKEGLRVSRRE